MLSLMSTRPQKTCYSWERFLVTETLADYLYRTGNLHDISLSEIKWDKIDNSLILEIEDTKTNEIIRETDKECPGFIKFENISSFNIECSAHISRKSGMISFIIYEIIIHEQDKSSMKFEIFFWSPSNASIKGICEKISFGDY